MWISNYNIHTAHLNGLVTIDIIWESEGYIVKINNQKLIGKNSEVVHYRELEEAKLKSLLTAKKMLSAASRRADDLLEGYVID